MRRALWIVLVVLVVGIGAPNVHADSFTATFTCTTCIPPTAPIPTVTNNPVMFPTPLLDITVFGTPITITLPFGDAPTDDYIWCVFAVQPNGLLLIDDQTSLIITAISFNYTLPIATASMNGDLTFPAVGVPEPSSVSLILLGIGLVFGLRKRTGAGLSRAS